MIASMLRGATELATLTGAADAAVGVVRGSDVELLDCARGSFQRRTVCGERCPQMLPGTPGVGSPWLDHSSLAELYLPLHTHVLALRSTAPGFDGVLLLRYDRRPEFSPADHVFLARAAADIAAAHAAELMARAEAAPLVPMPVAAPATVVPVTSTEAARIAPGDDLAEAARAGWARAA